MGEFEEIKQISAIGMSMTSTTGEELVNAKVSEERKVDVGRMTYVRGQLRDSPDRTVECVVRLSFGWLESRVIRLGTCLDNLLRGLRKVFHKMTYIKQT